MKTENRILKLLDKNKAGMNKREMCHFLDCTNKEVTRAIQNLQRSNLLNSEKHPSKSMQSHIYTRSYKRGLYICHYQLGRVRTYLIVRALRNGEYLDAHDVEKRTGIDITTVRQKLCALSNSGEILRIKPQTNKEKTRYKLSNYCSPEKKHFHNAFAALFYGAPIKQVTA